MQIDCLDARSASTARLEGEKKHAVRPSVILDWIRFPFPTPTPIPILFLFIFARLLQYIMLFFSFVVSVFILYNFHLPFIYRTFPVESSRVETKARGEDAGSHGRCSPTINSTLRCQSAVAASRVGASRGASCRSHTVARPRKSAPKQETKTARIRYGSCTQKHPEIESLNCRDADLAVLYAPLWRAGVVRCGAVCAVRSTLPRTPTSARSRACVVDS